MLSPDAAKRITDLVDEAAIVDMSKDVISIPSPTGKELRMGRYMKSVFDVMGLQVAWHEVERGRPNVVGTHQGKGNGTCLMFNGHMDTSYTGQEEHLTGIGFKPFPVVREDTIYGLGIYNMKGALVCYVEALKAVMKAGIPLEGDVMIAAVAGEIEKAQFGEEFRGRRYRGYGKGSHYLVNHAQTPDVCILGEPTDMRIVTGHCGTLWVRISTSGPYMHTGFSAGRQEENSVRRMHRVLDDVVAWIKRWESKGAYGGKPGVVNMGGIRGGHPWRVSRLPERTDLYLDVRIPPTMPMTQARREVRALVRVLEEKHPQAGIESEIYVSAPGAEISTDHPLIHTIAASHRTVIGEDAQFDTVIWSSDASVLTRYGIQTVNYGPSSGVRKADGEKVAIPVLVRTTQVYALVIAELCGAPSASHG